MALRRFNGSEIDPNNEGEWGPNISNYMDTFEDRIEASLARYFQRKEIIIQTSNDLIPIQLLETTLAVGENMHKVGYQSGSQIFAVLMNTIRGYRKLHKGDILEHYYGFLCVRHLIRMICIGIIQRGGSWDAFLKTIRPDCPWNRVTTLISEASHDIMHRNLMGNNKEATLKLLGFSNTDSSVFADAGGLTADDIEFLIDILWESRKSVLPLRLKRLLPGLPVFLFLLYNMTDYTDLLDIVPLWLDVQDLVQRCYLGNSSTHERNILRQVSRWIHDKVSGPFRSVALDYVPVDDDDARAVVKAYSDLLSPPISLSLAPIMLLDVSMTMYRWISYMLTNPRPRRRALDKLAPIAAKAALERLWLEIDRERDGLMANNRRGFTRTYAFDVLNNISAHYSDTHDPQIREDMLRMLLRIDIYGLLGRVLALVTHESEDALDIWEQFIDSLYDFSSVLKPLLKIPSAKPEVLRSEWGKVSRLLALRLDSSIPCPTPKYILKQGAKTWNLLLNKQIAKVSGTYVCSNPRCADPSIEDPLSETKLTCGGCGLAYYCSSRCQAIHWSSNVQPHSLECGENPDHTDP